MAGHTPGLHVRLARVEDYSDVIALREVHEGWDPLPYCYHKMLADPGILGVVAEFKGEIVSIPLPDLCAFVKGPEACILENVVKYLRHSKHLRLFRAFLITLI